MGAGSCSAQMHGGERLGMPLVLDRHAWLAERSAQAHEVAHLGCTDSPYTEERLSGGGLLHARLVPVSRVTGFDIDRRGLELLQAAFPGHRFVAGEVSAGMPPEERGRYDLVIAGEILEHVPDANSFLRGCAELLAPDGRLCVTVPNACCPKIGLRALAGRESVHPDHRVYYGPRTLQRTLRGAGLEPESMASCLAPVAGPAGRAIFNPLLRASHRAFRGPIGDGLIAVAKARCNAASIEP